MEFEAEQALRQLEAPEQVVAEVVAAAAVVAAAEAV
jgi:hypothetical protein